MPRSGRGGKRVGTPGQAYPNRSDMRGPSQPAQAQTGQPYGMASQQLAAQKVVPLPAQPTPGAGPATPSPTGPAPGSFGPFGRPTERPFEPVTAGAPVGPGPNTLPGQPMAPPQPLPADPNQQLRAIYQQFPVPELADLLSHA